MALTSAQVDTANDSFRARLGWSPAELGFASADPDHLPAAIRDLQVKLGVVVDGVCGPATYATALAFEQARLVTSGKPSLADAGRIAVCEAKRAWLKHVIDLPAPGTEQFERSRLYIDALIRSTIGIDWTWEEPYRANGQFEWCGTLPALGWGAAGMRMGLRRTYFPSTYRLDRYARYQPVSETVKNSAPAAGVARRMIITLDETSDVGDARFQDGTLPRGGDILLVGPEKSGYGKHITLIERYDEVYGAFCTLEGNGTGLFPDGTKGHGIVRAWRYLGARHTPGSRPGTAYHARRIIRPAASDLA